jgi:hypothetical protein
MISYYDFENSDIKKYDITLVRCDTAYCCSLHSVAYNPIYQQK